MKNISFIQRLNAAESRATFDDLVFQAALGKFPVRNPKTARRRARAIRVRLANAKKGWKKSAVPIVEVLE